MKSARRRLLLSLAFVLSAALASAAEPADIASLRAKAEKGNAIAQYNLGLAYADGREDLGADLAQAYVWLSLSGDSGSSRKALSAVLARMSDDQLAAAKRLLESYHGTPAARNIASLHGSAPKISAQAAAAVSAPFVPPPTDKPADVVRAAAPAPVENVDADEIAGLRKDKRQLSDELAIAWKDTDKLKASLATSQAEAARAQQLSQELEQRGHDLSTALAEVAKDNERLAAQTATVGRLQEELAAQTRLAAQTDAARSKAATTADAQAAEIAALNQKLAASRDAATAAAQTQAREDSAKAAAQLSAVQSQLDAANTRLTAANAAQAALAAKLAAANSSLSAAQGEAGRSRHHREGRVFDGLIGLLTPCHHLLDLGPGGDILVDETLVERDLVFFLGKHLGRGWRELGLDVHRRHVQR